MITAFPAPRSVDSTPGMELRDYFAAKAMHALLSNDKKNELDWYEIAQFSYSMAGAMMDARIEEDDSDDDEWEPTDGVAECVEQTETGGCEDPTRDRSQG